MILARTLSVLLLMSRVFCQQPGNAGNQVCLLVPPDVEECYRKFHGKPIERKAAQINCLQKLLWNYPPVTNLSQNELDYFRSLATDPNSVGLTAGIGTPPSGRRVRKEYRLMSSRERHRFHAALNKLYEDGTMTRFARLYAAATDTHHNGPSFLPWNRVFLTMFEEALRRYDNTVSIPFWDSTIDNAMDNPVNSVLWTPEYFGAGSGNVIDGPAAEWVTNLGNLERNYGRQSRLLSKDQLRHILSQCSLRDIAKPFASRRNDFEFYQGGPLAWVGGDMQGMSSAAYDPIFYMHRAFIDYVWELFRRRQYRRCGVDPAYDYPELPHNNIHAGDTPMTGFSWLTNLQGIKYDWVDNWYDYESTPSCPNCCEGCSFPAPIVCDRQRGVCVARSRRAFAFGTTDAVARSMAHLESREMEALAIQLPPRNRGKLFQAPTSDGRTILTAIVDTFDSLQRQQHINGTAPLEPFMDTSTTNHPLSTTNTRFTSQNPPIDQPITNRPQSFVGNPNNGRLNAAEPRNPMLNTRDPQRPLFDGRGTLGESRLTMPATSLQTQRPLTDRRGRVPGPGPLVDAPGLTLLGVDSQRPRKQLFDGRLLSSARASPQEARLPPAAAGPLQQSLNSQQMGQTGTGTSSSQRLLSEPFSDLRVSTNDVRASQDGTNRPPLLDSSSTFSDIRAPGQYIINSGQERLPNSQLLTLDARESGGGQRLHMDRNAANSQMFLPDVQLSPPDPRYVDTQMPVQGPRMSLFERPGSTVSARSRSRTQPQGAGPPGRPSLPDSRISLYQDRVRIASGQQPSAARISIKPLTPNNNSPALNSRTNARGNSSSVRGNSNTDLVSHSGVRTLNTANGNIEIIGRAPEFARNGNERPSSGLDFIGRNSNGNRNANSASGGLALFAYDNGHAPATVDIRNPRQQLAPEGRAPLPALRNGNGNTNSQTRASNRNRHPNSRVRGPNGGRTRTGGGGNNRNVRPPGNRARAGNRNRPPSGGVRARVSNGVGAPSGPPRRANRRVGSNNRVRGPNSIANTNIRSPSAREPFIDFVQR